MTFGASYRAVRAPSSLTLWKTLAAVFQLLYERPVHDLLGRHALGLAPETVLRRGFLARRGKSRASRLPRYGHPAVRTLPRTSGHGPLTAVPLSKSSQAHRVEKPHPSHLVQEKCLWPLDPLPALAEYLSDLASSPYTDWYHLKNHRPGDYVSMPLVPFAGKSRCAPCHDSSPWKSATLFLPYKGIMRLPKLGSRAHAIKKLCAGHKDSVRGPRALLSPLFQ